MPAQMIVAFGGAPTEFERLECPAVFVEDRRLRTRDHQRERQSYTGMLRDVLAVLPAEGWDFLYLAEFDMLPAVPDLWVRLQERMDAENADLLGHKVWKLDDTLHPHYSSHLATPGWLEWIGAELHGVRAVLEEGGDPGSGGGGGTGARLSGTASADRGPPSGLPGSGDSGPGSVRVQFRDSRHHSGYAA